MSRITSWVQPPSPGMPVAFRASGMQADVRIRIFEREFHVHSIVLRLYSAFFRTSLDSADKGESGSERGSWRYDYVSVMDPDGGWGLEVAKKVHNSHSNANPPADHKFKGLQSPAPSASPRDGTSNPADATAFEKLLCAMYRMKYEISGLRELSDITRLAESYCCLPAFSTSLYTALWHSPLLVADIPANCYSTLLLAQKLRHPLLFREALVHVVSQWKGYSRFLDGHYSLICAVTSAYNRVCERLLAANQDLFLATNLGGQIRLDISAATVDIEREQLPTQNAHFYRLLYSQWESRKWEGGMQSAMESLTLLLQNKLVLERGRVFAGEGEFRNGFLCATLEDDELPVRTPPSSLGL